MVQNQLVGHPPELSDTSVSTVRVIYPDLHGVARGKDVPLVEFDRVAEHGLAFCAAVMATDLRHTPVLGGEIGYPDLVAKPDLATLTLLPWEPGVACCIADVHPVAAGSRVAGRPARRRPPRRRRATRSSASRRSSGPELEFFLCERDDAAPGGLRRYVDHLSMVYTVGPQADPRGVVRQITEPLAGMGMGTFAANHEFMNSQYEINLRHGAGADRRRPRVPPQGRGQGRRRAGRAASPRSWASRSTTRAARASTCTSAPTATTTTRSPTATTPTACRTSCAASPPACSRTRPR